MTQAAASDQQGARPDLDEVDPQDVGRILEKHRQGRGDLIAILQDIQVRYGYLPEEALVIVAAEAGHSLVDIYGIATFYRSFTLEPRGRHLISACLGTACHVRGAPRIVGEFEQQLGIEAGETTADMQFTLETVNCLGACALGPVVVIDGHYFSKVRQSRVRQLLDDATAGFPTTGMCRDQRTFPIEVRCPRCNHSLMDTDFPIDDHPSIRCTVSHDHRSGWLRMSSVYDSGNISAEHDIPPETVVRFFCPHCHGQLTGRFPCPTCEAPMVAMMIGGGGIVQICSRRGCEGRVLNLT